MKNIKLLVVSLLACLCVSTSAYADNSNKFDMGILFDISAPSGVALGVEARLPYTPWMKLGVAATALTYPGIRGSVLLDPIRFPIAPIVEADFGHQFTMSAPVIQNSPTVSFNYFSGLGGIGLGSRDHFRFMLLAGMSYLDGYVGNVEKTFSLPTGFSIANPTFHGWAPSAKLGFNVLF